jgi:putative CRISPR-associated protein (TIGR02619 family)
MTVYLRTCGTSAAKNLSGPNKPRFNADWVEANGGVDAAADEVLDSFRGFSMDDEDALRAKLSAEIHSLARMRLGPNDDVVLFSSETADGLACATALQRYLLAARPGLRCRVRVVDGLQVTDADRFRAEGVLNFTKAVLAEISANGAAQCVLNPTGGFKSLVPYTVLIGMIKGVPAKYIFEQSTALIPLPVMPVEFARERLEPVRPLLERIEREVAIPVADVEAAIPFQDRALLAPLFEDVGAGEVTLSPVGFLIREELDRPQALVPYLSRRAFQDLVALRDADDLDPDSYLRRVAGHREQLDVAREHNWSQGLFWLKPGRTKDRYLVSTEGWRLLVWRICTHDEYDRLLDQGRKTDPGMRIAADRRAQYEPFVRMDLYESAT